VTQRQDTPVDPFRLEAGRGRAAYWLYVPSYYTDRHDWPLVITLHGTHGWDSSKAQIDEWRYLAEQRGLIVAAPKLKSVQGILPVNDRLWFRDLDDDERTILAVLEEVGRTYRIDPKAVLLTGFSAGGYPMYHVGLRHPELFSMLVARGCNSSDVLFDRIKLTDEARRLPVAIFWGRDDLPEINRQSWAAVRWLSEHDFKHVERRKIRGGHLRRPDIAYRYWRPMLPEKHYR